MFARRSRRASLLALSFATGVVSVAGPAAAQDQISEDEFFGDEPEDGDSVSEDEFFEEEDDDEKPKAPAAGKGAIYGKLLDGTGQPALEAQITVVQTGELVVTDFDGHYEIDLPPGTYTLSIFLPTHDKLILSNVEVKEGQRVEINDELQLEKGADEAIETLFEVEVEADESSIEGQLLTRKRATVVGDSIGRQEISKTPDRNAAAAVRRVVGVLIVDSKYVYVRGIGERYTNALLDGSPLPSPEPEQQTVPLDLFPTTVLDSLTVVKTFSPDMPGNFAGGSVRIGTRRLPTKFTFTVSGSATFNTQSTFRSYSQYAGGDLDWLGIDDGTRELSGDVPEYQVGLNRRRPDGSFIGRDEVQRVGEAINKTMATRSAIAPPNHRFNVTVGDTIDLPEGQKLGYQLTAGYNRSFERRPNEIIRTAEANPDAPGGFILRNDLVAERGIDKVRWSGLGGLTYQISDDHRLQLTGLYSRSSDDEAFEIEGQHDERGAIIHESRLTYVQRSLAYGALRGGHDFPELNDAHLDWSGYVSEAIRDQPDTRATVFEFDSAFGYAYEDDSQSGFHFFSNLSELAYGGGVDWAQPLVGDAETGTRIKFGGRVDRRSRDFVARRFRYRPGQGAGGDLICETQTWDRTCPDQIFSPDNITNQQLLVEDNTLPTDGYTAGLDIYAGYAMMDAHIVDNVRIIVGPRLEVSEQRIETFAPFDPENEEVKQRGQINGENLLPSVSLVWEVIDDMNLRLAASRTIARPQLREIAPFAFTDYFGGFQVQGNPELEFTTIWNGDFRWEWFPTLREVIAASVFAKRFEKPIETVVNAAGARGIITYQNAPGANLIGGELEARKNFGFITDSLEDLSLIANFTLAFSEVELEDATFVTNDQRPMAFQAPWIVNVSADYDDEDLGLRARVLYNIIGPRIVQVGTEGLPDTYEQPRHQLDVTAAKALGQGFEVRLSARNILNDDVRATFGREDTDGNLQRQYRVGGTYSVGIGYEY